MKTITKCSLSVIALAVLSACNGGGGDSSPGTSSTTQNAPPVVIKDVATDFKSDCDTATSADCGSKTSSIYAGTGVGIYKYTNNTNSSTTVNLGINGINAKSVYLVYSNPTNADVTLADGSGVGIRELTDNIKTASIADAQYHSDVIPAIDISKILATQNKKILSATSNIIPNYDVGTLRQQYNSVVKGAPLITTVLVSKKQFTNGSWLYVWADSSAQYDNQALNDIADTYTKKGGIFDTLTAMSGELVINPKNQQSLSYMISPTNKDQHVLFVKMADNVTSISNVTGMYNPNSIFKMENGFKSNAQHEIYVALEVFDTYKDLKSAKEVVVNTMAHETQHTLTFLNKNVKQEINTDLGLNEFISEMAESVNSSIQKDNMASGRMTGYLQTNNCAYIHDYNNDTSNAECSSIATYTSSYAVGAYLLRKYGAEFLGDVTKSTVSDVSNLDKFIKTYNANDSLADVLQKVSAIPLMKNKPIPLYSYPQKITNYLLDAYNYPDYIFNTYNQNLNNPPFKVYKTVPSTLKAMSSVIQTLGVVNSALVLQDNAPLQKYITVPAGVTVTAVVN